MLRGILNSSGSNIHNASLPLTAKSSIASFMECTDGSGPETTNNSLNARNVFWAPQNSSLTDIVLAFPGSSFNAPEVDNPAAYTVSAQIEYPAGTFTPVYSNGQRILTVPPGKTQSSFDPCSSLVIAPGAQYFPKLWMNWPIPGGFYDNSSGNVLSGNVCRFGVNVPDQTGITITTPGTSGGIAGGGYTPIVYATCTSPVVLGIIGTSHDRGVGDIADPNSGGALAWARAIRNEFPVMTFAKIGMEAAQYLTRPDGANIAYRNAITHVLIDCTTNDIFVASSSLATCQANLIAMIAPFLLRGVKVYTTTVTPRSTSTDVWLTTANQTVSNPAAEAVRVAYNAWIRANWRSLGIAAAPFDFGRAIDPTDSGVWSVDPGAQATSNNGLTVQRGWCTMSAGVFAFGNGSVASIPIAFGGGNGALFTNNLSTTVNCIVRNMPGDTTGAGAVVVGNTDNTGKITSFTVQAVGSGYKYPPLIAPAARRTLDGTHFVGGSYDHVISTLGLGPNSFS